MSAETRIEVTCPLCKHKWWVDLAEFDHPDQIVFLGAGQRRVETYRVKCPNDGTVVIIDVQVED